MEDTTFITSPGKPIPGRVRAPYRRPTLSLLGDISSITETGSSMGMEDGRDRDMSCANEINDMMC